jgi:hypothetical protein
MGSENFIPCNFQVLHLRFCQFWNTAVLFTHGVRFVFEECVFPPAGRNAWKPAGGRGPIIIFYTVNFAGKNTN